MSYISNFFNNEDGVETMEWIAIITVVAVLIGVCAKLGSSLKEGTKDIANVL